MQSMMRFFFGVLACLLLSTSLHAVPASAASARQDAMLRTLDGMQIPFIENNKRGQVLTHNILHS